MSDKIIRNPDRSKLENFEKPTPEYISRDIVPLNFPSQKIDGKIVMANNYEVGKENRSGVSQNNILNIGNHMDHTWSIDSEIEVIDNIVDNNIIDNNDYVSPEVQKSMGNFEDTTSNEEFNFSNVKTDEYIIIVNNEVLFVGSKDDAEEYVSQLVFGEAGTSAMDIDNIFLFKRVKIKAGIFLNE